MKRGLFLLLAASIGLNAGLLYVRLAEHPARESGGPSPVAPEGRPGLQGPRGRPGQPGPLGQPGLLGRTGPAGPAQQRPAGPPSPDAVIEAHLSGMTAHLDLNDEQQKAVRAVLEQHMPLMTELLHQADEANHRVSEAFAAPEFDAEDFKALVRAASQARTRADSLSAVMLLGEEAVLTAQQRIKYAEVAPTVHANPRGNPPPPRRDSPSPRPDPSDVQRGP